MSGGVSRRRGLPGPFVRLWRQPLRVGAIVLLAVTALAASGIQSAAAMALRATLDENWRGAYDILVTAPDGMQPIGGMLPPNTLASGQGLSIAQLQAVRKLDGIEVAAPIGEILVPGLMFGQPQVMIPVGTIERVDATPQAFRLTMTYTSNDGLGERLVERRQLPLIIDETPAAMTSAELEVCIAGESLFGGRNDDYLVDAASYPALKSALCRPSWRQGANANFQLGAGQWAGSNANPGEDFIALSLPSTPQTITRITLVDPEAERLLLGAMGAFLDPLVAANASPSTDVAAMTTWANDDGSQFGNQFDDLMAYRAGLDADAWPPDAMVELRQLFRDNDDDFDEMIAEGAADERFVPLLAAENPIADLSLKIEVEAFGDAVLVNEYNVDRWSAPPALVEGNVGESLGSVVGDVSQLLNPFAATTRPLVWPGVDLAFADRAITPTLGAIFAVGGVAAQPFAGGSSIALDAAGYAMPIRGDRSVESGLELMPSGTEIGAEAAYAVPDLKWSNRSGMPPLSVPVGTFDATTMRIDESAADYVPLGAYAPVSSTLTSGEHAGSTMRPSLSGLGLVSPRTVAIGSIYSSPLWDDQTPISAIRVRVAGIDAYTPQNQRRVIEVTQAIEELGLAVSIVAGSSPSDVDVQVDGYAFGTTDPSGTQTVGALGTVTQRWSELGAASRVSLSVSTATVTILGIALAAGILLLGAVQLAGIPGRREQSVVMREVGFTRARIARWFAAEEAPGLIIVVLVGVVTVVVSGGTGIATFAALVATGAIAVTAVASVIAGSRARIAPKPRDARSRRLGSRSVPAFGARQAIVHPFTTVVHVLAIAIVGLSAAALTAAMLAGRDEAGASSLALLAIGQQLWPQIVLGLAGIVGGILLARLTRRLDLARRAEQWATLRAAGWTSGQLATAQRIEGITVVIPGLALTAGLTWLGVQQLTLAPGWLYIAVGTAAGLVTGIIAFSTRRKGTT